MPAKAEQLFAMANQSRAEAGLGKLRWDPALAAAALEHCRRMVAEGPISHRYGGEPDLADRAGRAGAHFSLVEENIAVGPYPATIHQEWMESPGHRANMLNRDVDRVGIAVVAGNGVLYAVEDFAQDVAVLNATQVESTVAAMVRASGVSIRANPADARAACVLDSGVPHALSGPQPMFIMRWQDANLSQLPPALMSRLASRNYRSAAVGSCAPREVEGRFTVYRVAVLLY
jgi:hypothetical protein